MATDQTGPSAIGAAVTGWRDGFAAFARMPVVLGLATVAMLVLNGVSAPLLMPQFGEAPGLVIHLGNLLVGLAQGFLLTPAAIAVHRYVLLGELTGSYEVSPGEARFQRFFVFTVVFQLLTVVPANLMGLRDLAPGIGAAAIGLVMFVLLVVCAIVALRTLLLFPAIAVDAPGAEWRNALADAKGHSWRLFFIVLVTAMPSMLAIGPLYAWMMWPPGPSFGGIAVMVVVQSIDSVLMIAVFAAVASRLYLAFGDRLGHPRGIAALPA